MESSVRQPVQARSVATRAALLDATIESLCRSGYCEVTTNDIARRAGVSRGALLHHFPTKADLVGSAVEHLLQRRLDEFAQALGTLAPSADVVGAAIDAVWSMFDGPAFVAWVELWVAARTDPALAVTMLDVERRFTEDSRGSALVVFAGVGEFPLEVLSLVRDVVFVVMNGLALERLVPRQRRPPAEYLDVLKATVRGLLDASRAST
jgi:AcrR family transcriptional regulator